MAFVNFTSVPSAVHSAPSIFSELGGQFNQRPLTIGSSPKKRRLEEGCLDQNMKENKTFQPHVCVGRKFIKLPGRSGIFESEDVRPKRSTHYRPVMEDVMVNVTNIERISFVSGSFFVADDTGNYCGSKEGKALNLWRFDMGEKGIYISTSFLFTDPQVYGYVARQLEEI